MHICVSVTLFIKFEVENMSLVRHWIKKKEKEDANAPLQGESDTGYGGLPTMVDMTVTRSPISTTTTNNQDQVDGCMSADGVDSVDPFMPTAEETGLGDVAHENVVNALAPKTSSLGKYKVYPEKDRLRIGKYAAENGATRAVRKFSALYPKLNESTARGFSKLYKASLYTNPEQEEKLPKLKRGRPLMLGPIDELVVRFTEAVKDRGGHVSYDLVCTVAEVLMSRSDDPSIQSQKSPGKSWAKSLFKRMKWNRRATTTSKLPIPLGVQQEAELLFLHDIVSKIESYSILHIMVLNLDQTPSKYFSTNRFTMAAKGSTTVALAGSEDKRTITATFTESLAGDFLGMQLIYGGKTERSIPNVNFPKNFSLSANPKHYSSEEESMKVIDEIIIPYLAAKKEELGLPQDAKGLLILDVFRGQMTDRILNHLEENNILFVKIPANMTHILQPLDLSTNSWAKKYMKKRFSRW